MPLSSTDREAFRALMGCLGPGGELEPIVTFLRDHYGECLDELSSADSCDQVRTGLVRLLAHVYDGNPELKTLLRGVRCGGGALDSAWAGLCSLEIARHVPGMMPCAIDVEGNTLAMMAECAYSCGWTDRALFLSELAFQAGIDAVERRVSLGLRLAYLYCDDGRFEEAAALLEEVAWTDDPPWAPWRRIVGLAATG